MVKGGRREEVRTLGEGEILVGSLKERNQKNLGQLLLGLKKYSPKIFWDG